MCTIQATGQGISTRAGFAALVPRKWSCARERPKSRCSERTSREEVMHTTRRLDPACLGCPRGMVGSWSFMARVRQTQKTRRRPVLAPHRRLSGVLLAPIVAPPAGALLPLDDGGGGVLAVSASLSSSSTGSPLVERRCS